ncbi:MAG: ATP-dependent Clp protease adaptor ClpS [Myxococcota bacterium]
MADGDDVPGEGDWGSDFDLEGDQDLATETEKKVEKPRLYNVLLHNDNYTTMEFVVMVLMTVFHRSEDDAVRIMLHVHTKDVGIAGTYSFEVAETKADKVKKLARENEFPLRSSVELS